MQRCTRGGPLQNVADCQKSFSPEKPRLNLTSRDITVISRLVKFSRGSSGEKYIRSDVCSGGCQLSHLVSLTPRSGGAGQPPFQGRNISLTFHFAGKTSSSTLRQSTCLRRRWRRCSRRPHTPFPLPSSVFPCVCHPCNRFVEKDTRQVADITGLDPVRASEALAAAGNDVARAVDAFFDTEHPTSPTPSSASRAGPSSPERHRFPHSPANDETN